MDRILYWMLLASLIVNGGTTIVTTTTGPVSGKYNNVDGTQYISYEGIPYAQSPTGDLRFQAPVPIEPWTTVLNATTPTPVCLQEELLYTFNQMSENCLFLNIYSPDITTKLRPVFVFIHGGFFLWGSGNREPMLGPEKIINNGAIAVTLNYRLGVFGFISIGSQKLPGNAGLKDILLALKWISDNIRKFGGDPNNISLTGVGVGSMLAHYLMLTEKSHGLFQKVILLSGTALSYRALQRNPRNVVANLASRLRLIYTNDCDLVQQLKRTDPFRLLQVQLAMVYEAPDIAFVVNNQFMPCVESESDSAVITSDPLQAMKAGLFINVPVLMGFNNEEGVEVFPLINNINVQKYPYRINYLNKNFEACIPRDIYYPPGSPMSQELANSIRNYYLSNGDIDIFNVQNYLNLVTDTAYGYSTDETVRLFKQKADFKVYSYLLELDSDIYWFKVFFNITYPGAPHMDSLFFNQPITKPRLLKLNTKKQAALMQINSFLYNFLKYSDPTPPGITNVTVSWKEAGKERGHLAIGETAVFIPHPPFSERLDFWRSAYDQYYEYIEDNKY